jgi:glycerol-3-phosphate dehydrogenase
MSLRTVALDKIDGGSFDVFVVGGGINGAVSAAVLAGRGASVALVDRGDFGGFTSQESSNLVWGGFKYLEGYEFLLVRKLCKSRNRLIEAYPDNVKPIGFLATLDRTSPFGPLLAILGALAYWFIGGFKTHMPRMLRSQTIEKLEPVIDTSNSRGGIEYYDAYLTDNDSRFVFGFIRSALDVGAQAVNYVELVKSEQIDGRWRLTLRDLDGDGPEITCTATTLVNAAGPFTGGLNKQLEVETTHRLVFSKGIHLVVRRLTKGNRVLAFFDDTGRLFYIIPMGGRSVIGTTDTRVDTPYTNVTDEDRNFLLDQINARLDLEEPLRVEDVLAERCGVRPLVVDAAGDDAEETDWTKLSRKHEMEVDGENRVVTIFGGKLTDCLNVGEEVAEAIESLGIPLEPDTGTWYGEPAEATRAEFFRLAHLMGLDDLPSTLNHESLSTRLWRRYGRRAFAMLESIRQDESMADRVIESASYRRVELHLAASTEMVTRLEDFIRRRSKISQVVFDEDIKASPGLHEAARILFGDQADERLNEYFLGLESR